MAAFSDERYKCRLCGGIYAYCEMSEEHNPARNTGNKGTVALDLGKMVDTLLSKDVQSEIIQKITDGQDMKTIKGDIFDSQLAAPLYPKGRTTRSLCRKCNTFLGKYDEAYLRFFIADGNPKIVKGFQQSTKYQIIKAIYAKFLSLPEAKNEVFDFLDFVSDPQSTNYNGIWRVFL